jgi:HD-GYP domain-containing protein (c-di-GMP phosphodiesterase class II)
MLGAIELARVRSLRAILDPIFVSLQHHLLFSGGGYPEKPGGWELHPYVHVVAIADVYDAITTPRVYRERTLAPTQALLHILRNAGRMFDPRVAKVFIRTMGIYPVGTVVELDTGEKAVVVRQNENTRLLHRPSVALLGEPGTQSQPIDLAEPAPDGASYRRTIVSSVQDHSLEAEKAACFIMK